MKNNNFNKTIPPTYSAPEKSDGVTTPASMERKAKDFEVLVYGKAEISALHEHEQKIFYSVLLEHITGLMQGGK